MLPLIAVLLTQAPAVTEVDREAIAKAGLSDAAVAKLSGDQLHDILRPTRGDPDQGIAIIAVVGSYATGILMVLMVVWAIVRMGRLRAETLRAMVEKGVQIPPELIAPPPRPANDLRRGLLLSAFGVGLGIFLFSVADLHGMWTLGLVPLLVGVGYLISFRLTKPEPSKPTQSAAA